MTMIDIIIQILGIVEASILISTILVDFVFYIVKKIKK